MRLGHLLAHKYWIHFIDNEAALHSFVKGESKTSSAISAMTDWAWGQVARLHCWPWIERVMAGEEDVLWPGATKWFAQSSGTTTDQFKWLPVTRDALQRGHYRGGKDLLAQYCAGQTSALFGQSARQTKTKRDT